MSFPKFIKPIDQPRFHRADQQVASGFRLLLVSVAMAAVAVGSGCATRPVQTPASETTKYTLENTDKFAALDDATREAIACTGAQYLTLADGRMELIANLKNRGTQPIEIQTACVFRDDQGNPIGGETPWQTVTLAENTTQAVHFTAQTAAAKKYTVRVRQVR
jgi:uncharacterized protein YcfL